MNKIVTSVSRYCIYTKAQCFCFLSDSFIATQSQRHNYNLTRPKAYHACHPGSLILPSE